jgi:hypothetical protein
VTVFSNPLFVSNESDHPSDELGGVGVADCPRTALSRADETAAAIASPSTERRPVRNDM